MEKRIVLITIVAIVIQSEFESDELQWLWLLPKQTRSYDWFQNGILTNLNC